MVAIIFRELDERSVKKSWRFAFVKMEIRILGPQCRVQNVECQNVECKNTEKTKFRIYKMSNRQNVNKTKCERRNDKWKNVEILTNSNLYFYLSTFLVSTFRGSTLFYRTEIRNCGLTKRAMLIIYKRLVLQLKSLRNF